MWELLEFLIKTIWKLWKCTVLYVLGVQGLVHQLSLIPVLDRAVDVPNELWVVLHKGKSPGALTQVVFRHQGQSCLYVNPTARHHRNRMSITLHRQCILHRFNIWKRRSTVFSQQHKYPRGNAIHPFKWKRPSAIIKSSWCLSYRASLIFTWPLTCFYTKSCLLYMNIQKGTVLKKNSMSKQTVI